MRRSPLAGGLVPLASTRFAQQALARPNSGTSPQSEAFSAAHWLAQDSPKPRLWQWEGSSHKVDRELVGRVASSVGSRAGLCQAVMSWWPQAVQGRWRRRSWTATDEARGGALVCPTHSRLIAGRSDPIAPRARRCRSGVDFRSVKRFTIGRLTGRAIPYHGASRSPAGGALRRKVGPLPAGRLCATGALRAARRWHSSSARSFRRCPGPSE